MSRKPWPNCDKCGASFHQPYEDGLVECVNNLVEQRDDAVRERDEWKARTEKAEAALAEAARLVPSCGCTDVDEACELCRLDACLTTYLRGAEKRASREADARALASGEVSREELRRENGALAFPSSEIDWDQIQSLGGTRRAGR